MLAATLQRKTPPLEKLGKTNYLVYSNSVASPKFFWS